MKKILSMLLVAVMLVSSFTFVWAEEDLKTPSWRLDYAAMLWPETITREQFCELVYNMLDEAMGGHGGNEYTDVFTDTDNEKVLALSAVGIITGKGSGTFDPDGFLTREEGATILSRICDFAGLFHTELYYMFEDEADIADWAMSGVQTACNIGVMQGSEDNWFKPKEVFGGKQAMEALMQLHDAIAGNVTPEKEFADNMNELMPEDQNYMFSPISVKMALLMAANGAEGETLAEILSATGVNDLEAYNAEIQSMLEKYAQSDLLKLSVANSVWINEDKTPQRFLKAIQKNLRKCLVPRQMW